jgi:hypothetical protein
MGALELVRGSTTEVRGAPRHKCTGRNGVGRAIGWVVLQRETDSNQCAAPRSLGRGEAIAYEGPESRIPQDFGNLYVCHPTGDGGLG